MSRDDTGLEAKRYYRIRSIDNTGLGVDILQKQGFR